MKIGSLDLTLFPLLNQMSFKFNKISMPLEILNKMHIQTPNVVMYSMNDIKNSVIYKMQYYDSILNMTWELQIKLNEITKIYYVTCKWLNHKDWFENYLKMENKIQFITNADIITIEQQSQNFKLKNNHFNNLLSDNRYINVYRTDVKFIQQINQKKHKKIKLNKQKNDLTAVIIDTLFWNDLKISQCFYGSFGIFEWQYNMSNMNENIMDLLNCNYFNIQCDIVICNMNKFGWHEIINPAIIMQKINIGKCIYVSALEDGVVCVCVCVRIVCKFPHLKKNKYKQK